MCLGLIQLLQETRGVQLELGIGSEFRDDIVVVGVEPFGHLACGNATATVCMLLCSHSGSAAGYAEVIVQRIAVKPPHALRQIAQREAHIQYLIVKSKIAYRHQVQAGLVVPVALA
ncbi:hypothetical protein GALL_357210 [mine drainage metagenome]|uniref:Uncharacterized protein n=1 Tax=mine drainage metagenome TaxID=410659 RepID=A0A1J5QYG5_9ZZZZ